MLPFTKVKLRRDRHYIAQVKCTSTRGAMRVVNQDGEFTVSRQARHVGLLCVGDEVLIAVVAEEHIILAKLEDPRFNSQQTISWSYGVISISLSTQGEIHIKTPHAQFHLDAQGRWLQQAKQQVIQAQRIDLN